MKKGAAEPIFRYAVLILWALFALFPLIWMVIISFKTDEEVFTTTF